MSSKNEYDKYNYDNVAYGDEKKQLGNEMYCDLNLYNKCKDLIDEGKRIITKYSSNINIIDRSRIYLFHGSNNIDLAKFILYDDGYIKNGIWVPNRFQKLSKDNNIKDIIKKYEDALENLNNGINILRNSQSDEKNIIEFHLKDEIRLAYQDLSNIYYLIDNITLFIENALLAVDYGSILACSTLVKYYCDNSDYDNAYYYFEKCINIDIQYNQLVRNKKIPIIHLYESSKIMVHSCLYHYLFDNGLYNEAKKIAVLCKNYIVNTKSFSDEEVKEYEKDIEEWIRKCENNIENSLMVEFKESLLENHFETETINLMSNDVKIYVSTSLEIFEYILNSKLILDYSASLMPIMKAVEYILYEIIVNNYLVYLNAKDNLDYSKIDKKFINNGRLKKIDRLEYGSALHSIAKKDLINDIYSSNSIKSINSIEKSYIPNDYFLEFCDANGITDSKKTVEQFANNLDKLKDQRNKIAHKNRIFKEDADWCFKFLLDEIKFIDFLYKNFEFCFNSFSSNNDSDSK